MLGRAGRGAGLERTLDGDRIVVAVNMGHGRAPVALGPAGVPARLLISTVPGRAPGDVPADAVPLAPGRGGHPSAAS